MFPKLMISLIQTALIYLLVQLDGFVDFIMTSWEIAYLCGHLYSSFGPLCQQKEASEPISL